MSRSIEPYPILEIQPEWVQEQEALGSKIKFWYRSSPDEKTSWLFKYPQAGSGQHWAEKIAAEVANALRVFHARVELAIFNGTRGSTTESFARKGRDLFHGNQLLKMHLPEYDPNRKRFRQSDHSLENIFRTLNRTFMTPYGQHTAGEILGDYLVLDALIGNTDRHHENWGILVRPIGGGWGGLIAPTFDHASSLGRELVDESTGKCRLRYLSKGKVGQYSERARGAIYWEPEDPRALSPLDLVRRGAMAYPGFFRRSLGRIGNLDIKTLEAIVSRVPLGWMSELARTFAVTLMSYNLEQLRKVVV